MAVYQSRRDHTTGERQLEHGTRLVNQTFGAGPDTPSRLDLYHKGAHFARFFPTNDVVIYPQNRGEILRRRINATLATRGTIDSTWIYRPAGAGWNPTYMGGPLVINSGGHTQQVTR